MLFYPGLFLNHGTAPLQWIAQLDHFLQLPKEAVAKRERLTTHQGHVRAQWRLGGYYIKIEQPSLLVLEQSTKFVAGQSVTCMSFFQHPGFIPQVVCASSPSTACFEPANLAAVGVTPPHRGTRPSVTAHTLTSPLLAGAATSVPAMATAKICACRTLQAQASAY
jgi:hypothetical protein